LVLMFAKDYFIDRPKETIKLTYARRQLHVSRSDNYT
jgi:hypothetical protein